MNANGRNRYNVPGLCIAAALTAAFAAAIVPVLQYPGHDYEWWQLVLCLLLYLSPLLLSLELEKGRKKEKEGDFPWTLALIFLQCAAILMDLYEIYGDVTFLRDMDPALLEDLNDQLSYLAGSAQRVIAAAVLCLAQIVFCILLCRRAWRKRKQQEEEKLAQAALAGSPHTR